MSKTIDRKLQGALTVRELIEQLQGMPEDAKVLFVCDYGDYCHTQQALPCGEVLDAVTTASIVESGYSQSGLALVEDDGEEAEVEQLCSSDGTVIQQKIDGKWYDVGDEPEEEQVVIIRS